MIMSEEERRAKWLEVKRLQDVAGKAAGFFQNEETSEEKESVSRYVTHLMDLRNRVENLILDSILESRPEIKKRVKFARIYSAPAYKLNQMIAEGDFDSHKAT